jgi:hypothetical protein
MNLTNLKVEFRELLNSVNANFERLENLENIKESDFELFVSNLDALYKKGIVFGYVNAITESPYAEEPEDEKNTFVENPIEFSDLLKEAENQQIEKKSVEQVETIENVVVVEPKEVMEQATVVVDLKEEAAVVVDPVAVEAPIAKAPEPEVKKETVLNLVDIKSGIGINDKFQFIAELFTNNVDVYESAIKRLNENSSLESSLSTLEQIKKENNWKDESQAGERFSEIVKRRFL